MKTKKHYIFFHFVLKIRALVASGKSFLSLKNTMRAGTNQCAACIVRERLHSWCSRATLGGISILVPKGDGVGWCVCLSASYVTRPRLRACLQNIELAHARKPRYTGAVRQATIFSANTQMRQCSRPNQINCTRLFFGSTNCTLKF
jgi:hypothetical protein